MWVRVIIPVTMLIVCPYDTMQLWEYVAHENHSHLQGVVLHHCTNLSGVNRLSHYCIIALECTCSNE